MAAIAWSGSAIQRIYNREVLEGVATLDEWSWSDARRRAWLETYRDEMVIVAQGEKAVLGFAYCTPMQKFGFRFTREVTVYVDRDHHRSGVGRQLVEALIAGARERNLHVLIARITSENAASLALFESLGSERSALRKEFGPSKTRSWSCGRSRAGWDLARDAGDSL